VRPTTVIDSDHEFDGGSRIALNQLSSVQIENLVRLGKAWGFLKYHHPGVTAGKHHWDYELFRVLPKVLAAPDRDAANVILRDWIRSLGEIPECSSCATLPKDNIHLSPDVDWIDQEAILGRDLSALLRTIYRNRPRGPQFFISQVANIGNPVFEHEPAYPDVRFPDSGYQLLALYRFWNVIKYWYPNSNILDEGWDDTLPEFVPRLALAKSKDDYQLEMIALIAKVTDTHANLWSAPPQTRPPIGTCQLPVITRFIEKQAVVTGYTEDKAGPATGLKIGDVIETLDGEPVQTLVERWNPYYPASNQATRLRDIARGLTRGACTTARAGVRRESQALTIAAERLPIATLNQTAGRTHDLPGETFRLLSSDVAYLKLSSVKAALLGDYFNVAKTTKGLIIDIRNYPSEFVVFALGSLLVEQPTPFVRFTIADLQNPGAFFWGQPLSVSPRAVRYSGKIVILVDEVTLSQAEYTAMAFRVAPGAVVIGSTTAGADGNVSEIPLPGGHRSMISGIGVFYPDKKPTQRVGIIPDIQIEPTIAGVRAGRDEVLEEALRQILGRQTPEDQIRRLARPN
jgi:C-terminal processing protease CtpA/Prc